MTRAQRILLLVFSLMFYALAISTLVLNHRWFVSLLWAICGTVLLLTVRQAGRRRTQAGASQKAQPTTATNPQTRARRSGNPAVRANAETAAQDEDPDRKR